MTDTTTNSRRRGRPPGARTPKPPTAIPAPAEEHDLWGDRLRPLDEGATPEELRRHEVELRTRIFRAESLIAHHVDLLKRTHAALAAAGEAPFPYWRSKYSPWGIDERLEGLRPYLHFER